MGSLFKFPGVNAVALNFSCWLFVVSVSDNTGYMSMRTFSELQANPVSFSPFDLPSCRDKPDCCSICSPAGPTCWTYCIHPHTRVSPVASVDTFSKIHSFYPKIARNFGDPEQQVEETPLDIEDGSWIDRVMRFKY